MNESPELLAALAELEVAIVKVFAADTAGEPEWTTTGGQTMRAADFALGDWAVITSWDNLAANLRR